MLELFDSFKVLKYIVKYTSCRRRETER